jgi:hypothetical protein
VTHPQVLLPYLSNLSFLLKSAALLNLEWPSKVDGQVGLQDFVLGVDDGGDGGFQWSQADGLGEEASGALQCSRRDEV